MLLINFPQHNFRIKKEKDKDFVFDEIRKKWVILSPEEWVRQNFLQYLIQTKKYPASLISVEKTIRLGELVKRYDVVIYKDEKPWMIIECKEMNVDLNMQVVEQVLRYNMALPVPYLVITNGAKTFGYHLNNGDVAELAELPLL